MSSESEHDARDDAASEPHALASDTRWALEHPVTFSVIVFVGVAVFGLVVIGDLRAVIPVSLAAPIICWILWRTGGIMARRLHSRDRAGRSSEA